MQTEIVGPSESSPVVKLKNGAHASRFLVKKVVADLNALLQGMPNGIILLNDLLMACHYHGHDFYAGSQWHLAERGLIDSDGHVPPTIRDIVLTCLIGEGVDLRVTSPITD